MENQQKEMEKGGSGGKWIFFITGATACGKTTVAKYLAREMGLQYIEGDDVSKPIAKSAIQVLGAWC